MNNVAMNTNLTVLYKNNNVVTGAINDFLNRNIADSTRYNYNLDICQFFGVENIDEITDKMIKDVTGHSARSYFKNLENTYATSSISRKISSMKDLFNFIKNDRVRDYNNELLIDGYNVFENVDVSVSVKQYGSFTEQEVIKILDTAVKIDSVFYEMLVMTGVRKESIRALNINENFMNIDGEWCIRGYDKGSNGVRKEYVVRIGEYLYNECKKLAEDNENGSVFKMSENSALNRLKGFKDYTKGYCYKIGISEEDYKRRNLCLHSFKKTGIQIVRDRLNGDIISMMEQGHHNSPKHTTGTYMNREYNPHKAPNNVIKIRETNVDQELFNKLNDMDSWEIRDAVIKFAEKNNKFKDSMMSRIGL